MHAMPSSSSKAIQTESPIDEPGPDAPAARRDRDTIGHLWENWLPRLNRPGVDQGEALVGIMEYFQSGNQAGLDVAAGRGQLVASRERGGGKPPSASIPGLARAAMQRFADVKYVLVLNSACESNWTGSSFMAGIEALKEGRVERQVLSVAAGPQAQRAREVAIRGAVDRLEPGQAMFTTTPKNGYLTIARQSDGQLVVVSTALPEVGGKLQILLGCDAERRIDREFVGGGTRSVAMIVPWEAAA